MLKKKVAVIGAGISGLTSAFWLKKENCDVTVFEADSEVGGAMKTEFQGDFLMETGPNSGLETTPLIREIADEVGIGDQMIYANSEANNRYIVKNSTLMPLPASPPAFFKSKLFSFSAKLRLLKEPFVGKSDDGYYQSIAQFVERRLGKEFLDYAIDPFVSGVFAGDPQKLSVKSAFPKLYRLEELYGGLIKGMVRGARERKRNNEKSKQHAKMFSFKSGMHSYPKAIAEYLGDSVKVNCRIDKIVKLENSYKILYTENDVAKEFSADVILSTIPSHKSAKLFSEIDNSLSKHLEEIYYPPVKIVHLGFNKKDIQHKLDGFGFLIPTKEKRNYLGAIWSSVIFPKRSSDDTALFTMFVGGAKTPEVFNRNQDELFSEIISDFKNLMGIKADPILVKERFWGKAIPQYNLGHIEHDNYFEKFEKKNDLYDWKVVVLH
ncbi:MAG: protoporphyrinogen oxidase [Rhodothermaceae bacterium]